MCQVIAAFFFFYREDRAETAALYFVGKNQSFNGEFIELHLRVKMRTDLHNFKFRKKIISIFFTKFWRQFSFGRKLRRECVSVCDSAKRLRECFNSIFFKKISLCEYLYPGVAGGPLNTGWKMAPTERAAAAASHTHTQK